MAYEIWREQLVTEDGVAPEADTHGHKAMVHGDGSVELRLHDANMIAVALEDVGECVGGDQGTAIVRLSDMRAAMFDLERVSPWAPEQSSEAAEVAERAASCVERVCAKLDDNLLVTELRTTMLQLIERATRPTQTATVGGER